MLVIVIAAAALIFGEDLARAAIIEQASGMIGENGARAIDSMLASAQKPKQGVIASTLGILILIIGATTVFAELETNLNRIWKVESDKGSGLWHFMRTRLLAFGMVLAIGFLLIVSLVVGAGISAWGKYWSGWFGRLETLLQTANFAVSVVIITFMFAMIYKFIPRVAIRWRDVWIGALVTSLLFTFGKFLIGIYIGKTGVESSYGAAGALAVILVWVYYSAQIFLLGAEFTKVYAESHGSRKNNSDPCINACDTHWRFYGARRVLAVCLPECSGARQGIFQAGRCRVRTAVAAEAGRLRPGRRG